MYLPNMHLLTTKKDTNLSCDLLTYTVVSNMVACAAWGCSNCPEKGIQMCGLPTKAGRRNKYWAKISMSNDQR